MFPRAVPEWLDALERLATPLANYYDFERLDWLHLAGQMGAETNGLRLRNMTENMYFTTPARVRKVYSYRIRKALRQDADFRAEYRSLRRASKMLIRNPKKLADVVYGGREGTPWMQGSRYVGRGPTQITHLDNYAAIYAQLQQQDVALLSDGVSSSRVTNLVENPEQLATDPELGIRAAFADFHLKNLSRWARQDDGDSVSATLNTGHHSRKRITNNLSGRRTWTNKAKRVWPEGSLATTSVEIVSEIAHSAAVAENLPISEGSHGEHVEALQRLLKGKGFAVGDIDGHYGKITGRAVVAFQNEYDLPVDGNIDVEDIDALNNATRTDLGAREMAADVPGSQQLAAAKAIKRSAEVGGTGTAVEVVAQAGFGFSPLGLATDALGQVGDVVSRVTAVGLEIEPQYVVVLILLVASPIVWRWASKVFAARVAAHRSGLNTTR